MAANGGNMGTATPRFICSDIVSSFASFKRICGLL